MRKFVNLFIGIFMLTFVLACGLSDENVTNEANQTKNDTEVVRQIKPQTKSKNAKSSNFVDVPALANKPANKFDETFGEVSKITKIKNVPKFMPGEYREYKVEGHPKNLSVRFYKGKAKRFNLLLGKPEKSSKSALKKIFKIDIGGMRRIKSDKLSETWKGKLGKLSFKTAYAKRGNGGGDFVMLHAEIW